jgi:hypothetical protein
VRVFSGDLTVIANAPEHRVAYIADGAFAAIVKLCTAVPNHVPVSLIAADNDFSVDKTGKLVYVNMKIAQKVRENVYICTVRDNIIFEKSLTLT